MAEGLPIVQETILMQTQIALLKGENMRLRIEIAKLMSESEDSEESEPVSRMSPGEMKVEIKQCKVDQINLGIAIDNKTQQIVELEQSMSEIQATKEADEQNVAELRKQIRELKAENDVILNKIQSLKQKNKAKDGDVGDSNDKIALELEGHPSMSSMMLQLEADVQRLSDKLASLPELSLASIDVDEQMIQCLKEQLVADEAKIKSLEEEIGQLEAEKAEFEAQYDN